MGQVWAPCMGVGLPVMNCTKLGDREGPGGNLGPGAAAAEALVTPKSLPPELAQHTRLWAMVPSAEIRPGFVGWLVGGGADRHRG